MENLLGHDFYGKWRFLECQSNFFGTIRIHENGSATLIVVEDIPEDWTKKARDPKCPIIGNFIDKETKKGYCIILSTFLHGEVRHDFLSNYYLSFKNTLISYSIDNHIDGKWTDEVFSLDFDMIMLSGKILQDSYTFAGLETLSSDVNKKMVQFSTENATPKTLHIDEKQLIRLGWKLTSKTSVHNAVEFAASPWICLNRPTGFFHLAECFEEKINLEQFFTTFFKKTYRFGSFEIVHKSGNIFKVLGMLENDKYTIFPGMEKFLYTNFHEPFPAWVIAKKEIGFAITTFYEAHSDNSVLPSQKFVAYCFSLEHLHRHYYKDISHVETKSNKIVTRILEELKEKGDLYTWFKKRVNKPREVSFVDRVKDLLNDSKPSIYYEYDDYAKKVKDTRNRYVHLDSYTGTPFTEYEIQESLKVLSDMFIFQVRKRVFNSITIE